MEKSEVTIVIRWRIYLPSFLFLLCHIKGKDNVVADWASRMQEDEREVEESGIPDGNLSMLCLIGGGKEQIVSELDNARLLVAQDYLRQVHGGRMPHSEAKRT